MVVEPAVKLVAKFAAPPDLFICKGPATEPAFCVMVWVFPPPKARVKFAPPKASVVDIEKLPCTVRV